MQIEQHLTTTSPQTNLTDLACKLLLSTSTIAVYDYYTAQKLMLIVLFL